MTTMVIGTTNRGFVRAEFRDRYNNACSLQESSLATEDAIWLGVDRLSDSVAVRDVEIGFLDGSGQFVPSGARMHLTREHVIELVPYLQRFLETGRLDVQKAVEGATRPNVVLSTDPPAFCPGCGRPNPYVMAKPYGNDRDGCWQLMCRCGWSQWIGVDPSQTHAEMVAILESERSATRVPVKEPAVCPYCGQPVLRLERRYTVRQVDGDRVVRFHPSCAIETASQIRRELLQEASLYPRGQELVPPELR